MAKYVVLYLISDNIDYVHAFNAYMVCMLIEYFDDNLKYIFEVSSIEVWMVSVYTCLWRKYTSNYVDAF